MVITLVPINRVTWHTVSLGSLVYARKVDRGEYFPATVIARGKRIARVLFENGRRSEQFYEELAFRSPSKRGADKPARCQLP